MTWEDGGSTPQVTKESGTQKSTQQIRKGVCTVTRNFIALVSLGSHAARGLLFAI